jgi:hypothetical protein
MYKEFERPGNDYDLAIGRMCSVCRGAERGMFSWLPIISREWLAGSLRTRQPYLARIDADGALTVREIEE